MLGARALVSANSQNLDRELSQFIATVLLSTNFQCKKQHQQQTRRQINLQIEYDDKKNVAIFDEALSPWMSHPVESSICIFKPFHGLSIDSKTLWKRPFL